MNGLREVHSNRLLHLDVSPHNIYLRIGRHTVLLDFVPHGRRCSETSAETYCHVYAGLRRAGAIQARRRASPVTDVYSIGSCVYACMSGMPPQESDHRLKEDKMPTALRSFRGLYSNN